ncbi:MAG: hypothetical protein ACOYVF_03820 [Candidatus Zixiibacteriota bacterium]
MLRRLILPLFAVALLFWVAGCSDNPSTTDLTEETPDLNDAFGGYKATSEEPGFGDPELIEAESDGEEFNDVMLAYPSVDSLVSDDDAGMFHLRAVWGRLCYDSTVTVVTDWSGSLTLSRGAEIVRRVIRFEGNDYILPRTDRLLIEWVSSTTVHNDGIGVDIYVPLPIPTFDTTVIYTDTDTTLVIDTIMPEPVTLTFETGPYSRTFTLEELAALDTTVYLDDSNAVSFQGMQFYRNWCARGFLDGVWGYDSTGQGVFRGKWISQHGFISGWLKGTFGVNDDGERVFFGKWINLNGDFEGLLAGTYRPIGWTSNGEGAMKEKHYGGGAFEGKIYDADSTEIGVLKGRYHSMPEFRSSYFHGRWKLDCPGLVPADNVLDDNL